VACLTAKQFALHLGHRRGVPVAITIEAAAHVWEVLACAAPPLGINHVAKAGTKYVHGVAIQPTTTVFTASELPADNDNHNNRQ